LRIIFIFFLFFFSTGAFAECKFADLEKKAKGGENSALYIAARIYIDPDKTKNWNDAKDCNIKKNLELGIKYLELSAKQEYSPSLVYLGWNYFTGEDNFKKDFDKAIEYNKKASKSRLGRYQYIGSYNVGFFYYTGVGVKRDLGEAAHWFALSADQILFLIKKEREQNINKDIFWSKEHPKEILDEINKYNPNPTPEMIKVRDAYLKFLNSRDENSLKELIKFSKYYSKSCSDAVKFDWSKDGSQLVTFYDYKNKPLNEYYYVKFSFSNPTSDNIKITNVALKTKDKKIIVEEMHNLILPPFTKNHNIGIEKKNLMIELADYGSFRCVYTNEKQKNEVGSKEFLKRIIGQ